MFIKDMSSDLLFPLMFKCSASMCVCVCNKSPNNGASWPWTETMGQNKPSFLWRYFCHSKRKLPHWSSRTLFWLGTRAPYCSLASCVSVTLPSWPFWGIYGGVCEYPIRLPQSQVTNRIGELWDELGRGQNLPNMGDSCLEPHFDWEGQWSGKISC